LRSVFNSHSWRRACRVRSGCMPLRSWRLASTARVSPDETTGERSDYLDGIHFPMHVVSVQDVLGFDRIVPFQALLDQGRLVRWEPGMQVIFVSHQWCGVHHPDRKMRQFHVLQQVLRNVSSGSVTIQVCIITTMLTGRVTPSIDPHILQRMHGCYIWYDFFCVPQPNFCADPSTAQRQQRDAIESIPAYVALCAHFIVLTPGVRHEDTGKSLFYNSWCSRGWCRAEQAVMAITGRPILVVFGPQILVDSVVPVNWILQPPCRGEFGQEADRALVDTMIRSVLERRVAALDTQGDVFHSRFLRSLHAHYVQGCAEVDDLDIWRRSYGFGCAGKKRLGWSQIHFAALAGNCTIVRRLVADGVAVNERTQFTELNYFAWPGMTAAAVASLYLPPAHALPMLRTLLELRADLGVCDRPGRSLLHLAAMGEDSGEVCSFLVQQGLGVDLRTRLGHTPLHVACLFGRVSSTAVLLQHGAQVNSMCRAGFQLAISAAAFGGNGAIELLLHARADPNTRLDAGVVPNMLSWASLIALRRLQHVPLLRLLKNMCGMTPLHLASFVGDSGSVSLLLQARADVGMENARGMRAVDFLRDGTGAVCCNDLLQNAMLE